MKYLNLTKLLKDRIQEVFTLNEFSLIYDKSSPEVTVSRLKKNNFILSAGKNSGVYYNFLKINNINFDYILMALKRLYGSIPIILTGFYIISEYTTQITHIIEYIIPCKLRLNKHIDNTIKIKKPIKWFDFFMNYTRKNQFGILELLPEAVIFDMVINSQDYHHLLTPDELDCIDKSNKEDRMLLDNLKKIIVKYQTNNSVNKEQLDILNKIINNN
jgi:hypothetical protein